MQKNARDEVPLHLLSDRRVRVVTASEFARVYWRLWAEGDGGKLRTRSSSLSLSARRNERFARAVCALSYTGIRWICRCASRHTPAITAENNSRSERMDIKWNADDVMMFPDKKHNIVIIKSLREHSWNLSTVLMSTTIASNRFLFDFKCLLAP